MVQQPRGRTRERGQYNKAHDQRMTRMMEAQRRQQQPVINTRSNSPVFQPRTPSNSPPREQPVIWTVDDIITTTPGSPSNSPVFQPRSPSNSSPPEWAGGKNKSRKTKSRKTKSRKTKSRKTKSRKTKSRKTKSRKMKPRRLLRAMII
jgi:hypothetical protein